MRPWTWLFVLQSTIATLLSSRPWTTRKWNRHYTAAERWAGNLWCAYACVLFRVSQNAKCCAFLCRPTYSGNLRYLKKKLGHFNKLRRRCICDFDRLWFCLMSVTLNCHFWNSERSWGLFHWTSRSSLTLSVLERESLWIQSNLQ